MKLKGSTSQSTLNNPIALETIEYISLASPTNIYGFSDVLLPLNGNSNIISQRQQQKLLISTRNNLISIFLDENNNNGTLHWIQNELISSSQINPNINNEQNTTSSITQNNSSTTTSSNNNSNSNFIKSPPISSQQPNSPTKPVPATLQPNNDQVVSIDSYYDDTNSIIAISKVLSTPSSGNTLTPGKGYLTFYWNKESTPITTPTMNSSKDLSLSNTISSDHQPDHLLSTFMNQQTINLDFIPFQLTHQLVQLENQIDINSFKPIFLLSGSDEKIHLYYFDQEKNEFIEELVGKYYPEMAILNSCVLKMEIKFYKQFRLVALSCQNGNILLTITDEITKNSKSENFLLDGPVQSLKIFNTNSQSLSLNNYSNSNDENDFYSIGNPNNSNFNSLIRNLNQNIKLMVKKEEVFQEEQGDINLLCGSAVGYAMVFKDIINKMLQDFSLLEHSDSFDSVTCVEVFDIDQDGENELLIGTYGMELLVYKHHPLVGNYLLNGRKQFAHPILGIFKSKLMNDGIDQIIVTTMFGVNIMRLPTQIYQDLIEKRLSLLKEVIELQSQLKMIK